MWYRRLITIMLALVAGYWDATVSTWFPGMLQAVTLSLPLILVLAAFSTQERALTAALVCGVTLDVLLASNSGLVTVRYVVVALAIGMLSQTLLTNRSLVGAYALGFLALVINRSLLFLFEFLFGVLGRFIIPEGHAPFVVEALYLLAMMTVVFMGFAAFTKRFLPLISRQQNRIPMWRT